MANQTIRLKILNREKVILEEDVRAITSLNSSGTFDVLAEHANFISLIKDYLIIHKTNGSKEEMKLEGAVLRVSNNQAQVFIGLSASIEGKPKVQGASSKQ
ncbi:hypothetical protein M1349_00680 [Patescibacteria group bacterium]|nr:hypothetical protein [Patescibacteria group bacterium]